MKMIKFHLTTRTPAFLGYPRRLMITNTIGSYWIPSQNNTKPNLQICQNFKFLNKPYMWHTFWSCLIRCANMKWIRWVLLKIWRGNHFVHRRTDGQGETSIPPFQLCWSGGYNKPSFGSGNGLAPNRRQAITWTNADPLHWRIYAH